MKRLFKITIIVFLCLLGFSMAGVIWGIDLFFAPRPLGVNIPSEILSADISETQKGIRHLGKSYTMKRHGLSACYLAGAPEIRGAAMGRFLNEELEKTETFFLERLRQYIPNRFIHWVGVRYLTIRDSKLITYIPATMQKEMAGFITTSTNRFPKWGSYFSRLMQMQRLYEAAHHFPESENMTGSAFGVFCPGEKQDQMMMGGHFDVLNAAPLDKQKIVYMVSPEQGNAYCYLGWAGLFGAFSGMNQNGIAVTLIPANAGETSRLGIPVTLLVRQVLEEAGSLAHAVEIIKSAEIMQAQSFLIGSGKENAFWIVEKTPAQTILRKSRNHFLIATDFFQEATWRDDENNKRRKENGPSLYRYNRMKELLHRCDDGFDQEQAVAILRDRRGEFGSKLGLGNRRAINSLTAVQAFVMDLKQQVIWVSAAPHQIGKFVAFDINRFATNDETLHLNQDPFFLYGKYNEYLVFQHGLEEAQRFYSLGDYQESLAWLQEVRHLNPKDYRLYLLAGRALFELKRWDAAKYNYRQASKMYPVYYKEKIEIKTRLEKLNEIIAKNK